MEDYERTIDLVTVAQESEGKASEQFGKYQDTLENKINKLKNSWEQLRLSFANSDIFKNAVESLTAIVNKIESLDAKRLLALTPVIILVAKSFITTFINNYGVIKINGSFINYFPRSICYWICSFN